MGRQCSCTVDSSAAKPKYNALFNLVMRQYVPYFNCPISQPPPRYAVRLELVVFECRILLWMPQRYDTHTLVCLVHVVNICSLDDVSIRNGHVVNS